MGLPPSLGKRPSHHVHRRSNVIFVVALCLAALLGACGQADAARIRIPLLPDTTAKGNAWDWTAQCQFGPHSPSGCAASGPNLSYGQLTGDAWNLGGGPAPAGDGPAPAGSVRMSVESSGALAVR